MNKNISAIILIVIAAGIYFTITRGMLDDARAVYAVNSQYSSAINNAAQLISAQKAVTDQYNAISQEDRTRLDKMIPSTVDNIRLIIDLNNIALKHGFSLEGVKASVPQSNNSQSFASQTKQPFMVGGAAPIPGAIGQNIPSSVGQPTLDKVTVGFSAHTSYDNFKAFLADTERSLRIIDLTKLSVQVGETNSYDFTVQMQTYWLRQ